MADLLASNLFVYGRRAHGAKARDVLPSTTDLEACAEESEPAIFPMECGDNRTSGNEEGSCCLADMPTYVITSFLFALSCSQNMRVYVGFS